MPIDDLFQLPTNEVKPFGILDVFSIADGRLAGDMSGVYSILNWVFDEEFMTHHLPTAISYLKHKNPSWYQDINTEIQDMIKHIDRTDWKDTYNFLVASGKIYQIPRLKNTCDMTDFGDYMVGNTLLKNLVSKVKS